MTNTVMFKAKFHGRDVARKTRTEPESVPTGRIPRVTRLLALAHRFEKLIRDGAVRDYADLARLGHVTRARLTQIVNMLNLAPDIQEEILFLPTVLAGDDPIRERQLRPIMAVADWNKQRRAWRALKSTD